MATPEERAVARAARLAEELASAWRRGERPCAEDWLEREGDLARYPAAVAVVLCEEAWLRREFGRSPRAPGPAALSGDELPARPGRTGSRFPACGEIFAECRLVAELGRGAQGRVFLATQPLLADRPVVLKITPCTGAEHLSLARLWHTHIVPLHFTQDFPERGLRVLCMPYLGGATLADVHRALGHVPCARRTGRDLVEALARLRPAEALPPPEGGPARAALARLSWAEAVCWLGACLADALQHAHERGLVHLDVKPSNLLLTADCQPMLLDFHLARAPLAAGSVPAGWFGGTADYMAPEQRQAMHAHAAGRPLPAGVDGRSDLYSLGRTLYELLGGDVRGRPGAYRPLRECNPAAGTGLSDVIAKCLATNPAARYPDAGALAADLRRHLVGLPLQGVRNRSAAERWRKWRRRRPHALPRAALAAAALVALATAAVLGLALVAGARRDAEQALAGGRELQRQGRHGEAERELARGLDKARAVPGGAALVRELDAARGRAHAAGAAQELARCADELRFLGDPAALRPGAARALDERCARVWADRAALLSGATVASAETVRRDLLDLAVLWAGARARAAAGEEEGRRRALAVLGEAEALLGGGPVLEQERRRLGDGPGKAGAAAPRTAWEHEAVGRALLFAGRAEEGAAELEEALALNPQGLWANFYHGLCAHRLGRYEEAAGAFRACVALAPRSAPCYYNRALSLAALGRDGPALRDYDRALQLDPGLAAARLNRGALYLRAGRLSEAAADLERALVDGADPAAAHYDLALVCRARGEWADCRRHLRAALRERPDHRPARDLLARLPGPR
jgi:tetratricopeptide (TPR) repeat protein